MIEKLLALFARVFARNPERGRRVWPCVSDGDYRVRNAQALSAGLSYRRFVASRRRRLYPFRGHRRKGGTTRPVYRRGDSWSAYCRARAAAG